jgi:glycosyltransferase involved in cell wall biosynthesis
MACAIPCVVTDVGDSSFLVGDAGRTCPPSDPEALAAAILSILRLAPDERQELAAAARRRMEERFEAGDVARRFATAYRELR